MPSTTVPDSIWSGATSRSPSLAWTSCRHIAPISILLRGSGNSRVGCVSTIATLVCWMGSLPPSKIGSQIGSNPTMPFVGYAQLLKTLCLEQIQFLHGHVSVQTKERYLGCKQRLRTQLAITSA